MEYLKYPVWSRVDKCILETGANKVYSIFSLRSQRGRKITQNAVSDNSASPTHLFFDQGEVSPVSAPFLFFLGWSYFLSVRKALGHQSTRSWTFQFSQELTAPTSRARTRILFSKLEFSIPIFQKRRTMRDDSLFQLSLLVLLFTHVHVLVF